MRLSLRTNLVSSMVLLAFVTLGVTATLLTQNSVDKLTTDASAYRRMVLSSFIRMTDNMLDRMKEGMSFVGKILPQKEIPMQERQEQIKNWMKSSQSMSKLGVYNRRGARVATLQIKESAKNHLLAPPDRLTAEQMKELKLKKTTRDNMKAHSVWIPTRLDI